MTGLIVAKLDALSIQQPWGWTIVNRYKPVENRDWATKRRGPVLIHAGKKFDRDGYDWIRQAFPEIPLPKPEEFQLGGIIGMANLTDCVTECFSRWFFGEYGFLFADAVSLPFIPCRGKLGFFKPDFGG